MIFFFGFKFRVILLYCYHYVILIQKNSEYNDVYKTSSSLFPFMKRKALDVKVIESSVTSTYCFRSFINISKSRVLPDMSHI